MCRDCWETQYHSADVDNAHVRAAVPLIALVYEYSAVGGNLHVMLDDWNLETHHFGAQERRWIRKDKYLSDAARAAEWACFNALRWMTVAERASALARYDGYIHNADTLRGLALGHVVFDEFPTER